MRSVSAIPLLLGVVSNIATATSGFRALVLTDVHYDELYVAGSDPTQDCHRGTGIAGEFGVRNKVCDTPKATLMTVLSDMNGTAPYDVVFYLGDSGRHPQDSVISRTSTELFGELASVAAGLRSAVGGSMIILPTIGNDDVDPHDTLPAGPNGCLNSITSSYSSILPREVMTSFRNNGSYVFRIPNQPVVVISINSMYFAKLNTAVHSCNHDDSPGAAQMAWLRKQVQLAADAALRVIIIGHVPPPLWHDACASAYASLSSDFASTLSAHLYAHRHYDTFYLLNSDGSCNEPPGAPRTTTTPEPSTLLRGSMFAAPQSVNGPVVAASSAKAVAVALVAPSVMPHFNPTFRMMQFAADGSLDDYTQYYYDLDAANAAGALKVKQEYSARAAYPALSLNGLTTDAFASLYADILSNPSTAGVFAKYAAVSWADAPRPSPKLVQEQI